MSHPASFSSVDGLSYPYATDRGHFQYDTGGITAAYSYAGANAYGKTGVYTSKGRAASVSNPRDSSGWRSPSAYNARYCFKQIDGVYGKREDYNVSLKGTYHKWFAGYSVAALSSSVREVEISTPSSAATSLQTATLQKALRKFRRNDHEESVDLSTAYLERAKTARMVEDTAHTLTTAFMQVRRKQFRKAWDTLMGAQPQRHGYGKIRPRAPMRTLRDAKEASKRTAMAAGDDWLAFRYGWRPLVGDIYGACEQIALQDSGSYDRYRIKAAAKSEVNTSVVKLVNVNIAGVSGKPSTQGQLDGVNNTKASCKVVLYASRHSGVYVNLLDVGVGDPLTTAWEMLPYSFVLDWFLGVGDFLEAATALNGYDYKGGSCTFYEERDDTYTIRFRGSSSLKTTGPLGSIVLQGHAFNRVVLNYSSLFPTIIPNWEIPSFKRMTDAVALLGTAMGRPARRESYHGAI